MRKDLFWHYLNELYNDVPLEIYEGVASVFCIVATIIIAFLGIRKGWRLVSKLALGEYILLLFCATVFCRPVLKEQSYNFRPFWSYFAMHEGRQDIASESIMNVVVFLPVGLLLGMAFRSVVWWKVLLLGLCFSTTIELMQFLFVKGFAEFDDVVHNTFGCMLGYSFYRLLMMTLRYAK